MSALDEEVVFFSRRRPGKTFDRRVAVQLVKVAPCGDCGGRRVAYSRHPHSPHSNGRGATVDCVGRTLQRCSLPGCGFHIAGEPCPQGGAPA